jgi:hypothetical protein
MTTPFPFLPTSNITLPSTPLILSALAYTRQHTTPTIVNHTIRSLAFALLLARKTLPKPLSPRETETLALATLMHDLGWSSSKELISRDKRFEVDGAAAAVGFIEKEQETEHSHSRSPSGRTEIDFPTIWTAIALHTSPSIAQHHPVPIVSLTSNGIFADFLGPKFPHGLITPEEHKEIVTAFPRLGFTSEGLKEIMCGLCREKAETTYDNFVGLFGLRFPENAGEGFKAKMEGSPSPVDLLMGGLDACKEFE